MAEFRRLCAAGDLPPGTGRTFHVEGREIALFNVDGRFHAIDNVCCHAGGPLGEGMLRGAVVTCPWHSWQFDVTTGRSLMSELLGVNRFDVRVRDGWVEVSI